MNCIDCVNYINGFCILISGKNNLDICSEFEDKSDDDEEE